MVNVLVIIPTYNESENIAALLSRLNGVRNELSSRYKIDMLIVDDNSPDKTIDTARSINIENLSILSRSMKGGIGPAYLAGFELGLKNDYQYFVQMDADLSHMPEQLEKLLAVASCKRSNYYTISW